MIWIRDLIQIRDLQQLLCVNINNKKDTIWRISNNIRFDKTSNMLFLNDLNPSEIFQKVHFFDIIKVDCSGTHCLTTTSYQIYQAWRPPDICINDVRRHTMSPIDLAVAVKTPTRFRTLTSQQRKSSTDSHQAMRCSNKV